MVDRALLAHKIAVIRDGTGGQWPRSMTWQPNDGNFHATMEAALACYKAVVAAASHVVCKRT